MASTHGNGETSTAPVSPPKDGTGYRRENGTRPVDGTMVCSGRRRKHLPGRRQFMYAVVWARFTSIAAREHPQWWNQTLNPNGPGALLAAKLTGIREILEHRGADPGLDLDIFCHLLRTWPLAAVDYGPWYLVGQAQHLGLLDARLMPVRGAQPVDEEQRRIAEMINLGGPGAYKAYRDALQR